ncbi:16S rRNA (adenine(1518)-N(6)/adenine(1519)-N(6))-dimethyltransferase RsmA [Thomasclavelia sp.]
MKDIATLSTTKYILEKYNLNALKKFGQNFLIDTNIVNKIINQTHIDKNTAVIEVGPGIGALTQILGRSAGKVISFEIDERFKPVYNEFLDKNNIDIIFGDFMKQDIKIIVDQLRQDYQKVYLVANLPYYITTEIIEKVILNDSKIDELIIMIQKENALKMVSDYKNPLLLMIEDIGSIEYLFTVNKNVFIPAPHVDSAIIKIKIDKNPDLKLYETLKLCFKQRRKTILNNLKQKYNNAEEILIHCNIETRKRSEELSLEDFKHITDRI